MIKVLIVLALTSITIGKK